ncbi:MAG TPA: hypothetical protein VL463_04935 [Kofleriaceae bacterium]|jgi:hypothetical protein|nr:hypothetical protein [Kofleriaceae bacterium]
MQQAQGRTQAPRHGGHNNPAAATFPRSVLEGLWVLLVDNEPMMARAGDDQTYVLGFKNVAKAKQFMDATAVEGAVPRMVVRGNKDEILKLARNSGVFGVLVDYDPATNGYAAAAQL